MKHMLSEEGQFVWSCKKQKNVRQMIKSNQLRMVLIFTSEDAKRSLKKITETHLHY